MAQFHTPETIQTEWPEAVSIPSQQLQDLLDVAEDQCLTYAPLGDGETRDVIPDRYRLAHRLQTQALWRASSTTGDRDTDGMEGYQVTVRPMDWTVTNLLRPRSGVPVLG